LIVLPFTLISASAVSSGFTVDDGWLDAGTSTTLSEGGADFRGKSRDAE
jgi:hypothetical protein